MISIITLLFKFYAMLCIDYSIAILSDHLLLFTNTLTSPINLYMTISGELKIKQSQKINNNKKKTENPFLYCL